MSSRPDPLHGRGAGGNPPNRFERLHYEPEPGETPPDPTVQATVFFRDHTRSVIATNDSPDVPFEASINPYRGCEHGCVYCFARPFHEYQGLSAGLDFESKIFVKEDAPELLRNELSSPKWKPKYLALSGVTDPYQPIERRLGITRRVLEVLRDFRNPVGIVTKSALVARDKDLLGELAGFRAAAVFVSVTTLDGTLARKLEPRAPQPAARLGAINELSGAGIPVGVMAAPVIPGLTDHELPAILESAAGAGARFAGFVPLRLPHAVGPLFEGWLDRHFPDRKDKVLGRVRAMRAGRLNDPNFGSRMRGRGKLAQSVRDLFHLACRRSGLSTGGPELSTEAFRRPPGPQLLLFD